MTTPTKRLFKSCYNMFQDLPKKPGKTPTNLGLPATVSSGARGTNTPVSEALINAVDDLFHQTLLNNTQIAARLLERGLQTTGRQVRSIRQRSGWLRVTSGPDRAAR